MAKKKHHIKMKCQETGLILYWTRKNAKQNPDKLKLKKYNPKVKKVTEFVETKK